MKLWKKLDDAYWACYRGIRDYIFYPTWYRVFGHKHHIVKTGLPPSPWYDTDYRMFYAVMSLVKWFVEKDMMKISKEDYELETERIKKDDKNTEFREDYLKSWEQQYETQNKIIEIYEWWKNYPNREKEIKKARHAWHSYVESFQKDKEDFFSFFEAKGTMTPEQKLEEKRLVFILHDIEDKLEKESDQMMMRAVELRVFMWS